MSASTGPVLATAGVTMFRQVIVDSKPPDLRVPLMAGVAAVTLSLVERAGPPAESFAKGIAWIALTTALLVHTEAIASHFGVRRKR
jgi:hypothetical protein